MRRRRGRHEHRFAQQRVGGGLVRRVCGTCRMVSVDRNAWPILRWRIRGERPGLFATLPPSIFVLAYALVSRPAHSFGHPRRRH